MGWNVVTPDFGYGGLSVAELASGLVSAQKMTVWLAWLGCVRCVVETAEPGEDRIAQHC